MAYKRSYLKGATCSFRSQKKNSLDLFLKQNPNVFAVTEKTVAGGQ